MMVDITDTTERRDCAPAGSRTGRCLRPQRVDAGQSRGGGIHLGEVGCRKGTRWQFWGHYSVGKTSGSGDVLLGPLVCLGKNSMTADMGKILLQSAYHILLCCISRGSVQEAEGDIM